MSVRAGSIITVAGRNVVDRLQDAGLGNAKIPVETIREIGNDLVVDKVPGEADFTFSMTSWDVSTDLIAFLQGAIGDQAANLPPGHGDAAGTEYRWENCQFVNLTSPWKNDTGSQGGHIGAGIIIPAYYPTRLRYQLGVAENASVQAELNGAEFYYATTPPVEENAVGDGAVTNFVTSEAARAYRVNGAGGATFRYVFGVLVNGVVQVPGVDYTETGGAIPPAASTPVTIAFAVAPSAGAVVRFCYFTEVAKTFPQAVNADAILKPGAVRGRDIDILVGTRGVDQVALPGVQQVQLEATSTGQIQREMGQPSPIGRNVEGTDTTGTFTLDPRDNSSFFSALSLMTGVAESEVIGYLNTHPVPVEIRIRDPKNAATVIKTLYVADGIFQPPGTPARVNQPTQFAVEFDSQLGTFSEFKGARP